MSEENIEVPVEESRPDWLPDNFKSPEDLAKSYQSQQSKLTQQGQEISSLKQQVESLVSQHEQTRAAEYSSTIEDQLIEAIDSGDPRQQLSTLAWLAQEAAKNAVQQFQPAPAQPDAEVLATVVNQKMRDDFPDWDEIRQDVGSVVQEMPGLIPSNASSVTQIAEGLKTAYQIAKARKVLSTGDSIRSVEAEAAAIAKNAAQTITGASQRPATSTPAQELWESIKQAQTPSVRVGRI